MTSVSIPSDGGQCIGHGLPEGYLKKKVENGHQQIESQDVKYSKERGYDIILPPDPPEGAKLPWPEKEDKMTAPEPLARQDKANSIAPGPPRGKEQFFFPSPILEREDRRSNRDILTGIMRSANELCIGHDHPLASDLMLYKDTIKSMVSILYSNLP